MKARYLIPAAALALSACGLGPPTATVEEAFSEPSPVESTAAPVEEAPTESSTREQACEALTDGESIFQVYRSAVTLRGSDDAAVIFLTDTMEDHCPEHLEEWQATAMYASVFGEQG